MKQFFILLTLVVLISCNNRNVKNSNNPSDSLALFVDYAKPDGKIFKVDNVELADSLLNIDTAKNVFENKIGKKIMFYPEEYKNFGLVNCYNNGLIQTIQECYNNHRPLILTPDAIWLAICQGVSIHINEKIDSLKSLIFIKNKPNKIEIRNDDLEYNANAWKSLISSFTDETKKYTKDDYYSFFVSQFTTTTEVDKSAYQITLLESYKKVFQYIGDSGCGIPSITITGEKKDWQLILSKLDMLDKLGLSNWGNNLKPIITEFINVFDGKVNKDFWKSIYKDASEYNAFYLSGWIIKFFPYIKITEQNGVFDEKMGAEKVGEKYIPNKFIDGKRYLLSTLSTDNFPSGIAKIDVTWNNLFKGVTKKIEVYDGFFAIKQYSDKTLEPFISWVVCEKDTCKPNHKMVENNYRVKKHSPDSWSPHVADSITDFAIYNIKKFKNQSSSLDFIKNRLLDSIKMQPKFCNLDLSNDTLEFIVFSDGSVGEFKLRGNMQNVILLDFIERQFISLPEKWFPALAHPYAVFAIMGDLSEDEMKSKIRVHSMILLKLDKK